MLDTTRCDEVMFSGRLLCGGGLSNSALLAELCPSQFKEEGNAWRSSVCCVFYLGAKNLNDSALSWNTTVMETRIRRFSCFGAALSDVALDVHDRVSVATWMLSRMLVSPPDTDEMMKQLGPVAKIVCLDSDESESDSCAAAESQVLPGTSGKAIPIF